MPSDTTLNAVLAMIAEPNDTTTSAEFAAARDALDIPGARAAVEVAQGKHDSLLLRASDAAVEHAEVEIRTANRDLARRLAAEKALAPLIEAAQEREKKAAIEQLGKSARTAQLRCLQAYVELDKLAVGIVEVLADIRRDEGLIADANQRLREAGQGKLTVGLPADELAQLAGCEGQFLPRLDWWNLHGYMAGPAAALGDSDAREIVVERRFGRLAELLPGAPPSRKAA